MRKRKSPKLSEATGIIGADLKSYAPMVGGFFHLVASIINALVKK